ncbi:MAG TPA: hypothetical protein VGO07_07520 [Candidatus Saccharimonadales bacterium]|jgi:hypothetical protein|nr:hypothetical protein [Candidatus Saccharimonadales bacterium]
MLLDKVQRKLISGDIYTTPTQAVQSMNMPSTPPHLVAPGVWEANKFVALAVAAWIALLVLAGVVYMSAIHGQPTTNGLLDVFYCMMGLLLVVIVIGAIISGHRQKKLLHKLPDWTARNDAR